MIMLELQEGTGPPLYVQGGAQNGTAYGPIMWSLAILDCVKNPRHTTLKDFIEW